MSPFFVVRDLPKALEFYRDALGFEVTFTGDGDFFAIVRRDGVQFLLKSVGVEAVPNRKLHADARWDAFVHVSDPDGLAAELSTRSVPFEAPLADTDDGLRGFEVADRDGYVLFFGRPR
ncbi:MAG: VOC family protein [Actinophytocola sp.]|uniref:VOC family protein n=1 Tax=Actinophytocola sp. TaxID=1872138 RepID=UPI003C7472EB